MTPKHYNGVYGAGGGITILSDPGKEWEELQLKARFLTHPAPPFQLIETMRCEEGEIPLLDLHLDRLRESAEYFGFIFNKNSIQKRISTACHTERSAEREDEVQSVSFASLLQMQHSAQDDNSAKLRLLLARDGVVTIESSPLPSMTDVPLKIAFANKCVDSSDVFLYHKTTHRSYAPCHGEPCHPEPAEGRTMNNKKPLISYDHEHSNARSRGLDDVLFLNERKEVTEGCIHNVIVEIGGQLWTPPMECGLLPGVLRRKLIEEGTVRERILTEADVQNAENIFLCNAVKGIQKALLTM